MNNNDYIYSERPGNNAGRESSVCLSCLPRLLAMLPLLLPADFALGLYFFPPDSANNERAFPDAADAAFSAHCRLRIRLGCRQEGDPGRGAGSRAAPPLRPQGARQPPHAAELRCGATGVEPCRAAALVQRAAEADVAAVLPGAEDEPSQETPAD